jgi:alkyl sulfatase BDS1-like metallo-beta-lactamase superfamily hydrolase
VCSIGCGLGPTNSLGHIEIIAPTIEITRTGQEETLDGLACDLAAWHPASP